MNDDPWAVLARIVEKDLKEQYRRAVIANAEAAMRRALTAVPAPAPKRQNFLLVDDYSLSLYVHFEADPETIYVIPEVGHTHPLREMYEQQRSLMYGWMGW